MVKEPAGTGIITTPAELWNSEVGDFDMTILNKSSTESSTHTQIAVASSSHPSFILPHVANNFD